MSFIVSFTPPPPGQTREAQHRRRVRQRGALVTGTVLLVGALAALPLPVWNAGQQLDLRASELRGWTEDARRDEREAQAFRASDGEAESARGAAEIARWLVARDRIDTTKELLALARATGLRVVRIDVQADSELLSTAAAAPQGTAVLGVLQAGAPMAAAGAGADGTGADGAGAGTGANGAGVQGAEAGAARASGAPLPLRADRFEIEGYARASSLLLFCGVQAAMPAPLRLRTLKWTGTDSELHATITLEKLRPDTSAPPTAEAPERDVNDDA